jgi:hypothetical protein
MSVDSFWELSTKKLKLFNKLPILNSGVLIVSSSKNNNLGGQLRAHIREIWRKSKSFLGNSE